MSQLAFFDSNILTYTDDASEPRKRDIATSLVGGHQRAGTAVYSVQVMQEFFAVVTRKLGVDAAIAQRKVEILARGLVVRLNEHRRDRCDRTASVAADRIL